MPCLPKVACPGGIDSPCALGYQGRRCGMCANEHSRALDSSCVPCPPISERIPKYLVAALLASAFLANLMMKGIVWGQSASSIVLIDSVQVT